MECQHRRDARTGSLDFLTTGGIAGVRARRRGVSKLQAKDLAVAEQIKRGRSWWLRSKSLEGELQAKETEMMENRETYRELKALNAMESRREVEQAEKTEDAT